MSSFLTFQYGSDLCVTANRRHSVTLRQPNSAPVTQGVRAGSGLQAHRAMHTTAPSSVHDCHTRACAWGRRCARATTGTSGVESPWRTCHALWRMRAKSSPVPRHLKYASFRHQSCKKHCCCVSVGCDSTQSSSEGAHTSAARACTSRCRSAACTSRSTPTATGALAQAIQPPLCDRDSHGTGLRSTRPPSRSTHGARAAQLPNDQVFGAPPSAASNCRNAKRHATNKDWRAAVRSPASLCCSESLSHPGHSMPACSAMATCGASNSPQGAAAITSLRGRMCPSAPPL